MTKALVTGCGSARQPGGTQIVQSASAMTAGPTAAVRATGGRSSMRIDGGSRYVARTATTSIGVPGRAYPLRRSWAAGKSSTVGTRISWRLPFVPAVDR